VAFHEFTPRGDVHGIHYWTYRTYADRDTHNPSEGPTRLPNLADVTHKRVCLVLEDSTFYALHGLSPIDWRPLSGGGGRVQLTVPPTVAVLELVYSTGELTADRADNTALGKSPIVGAVVAKPTSTLAIVVCSGVISGYSGLAPGSDLFLGVAGGVITPPLPTAPGTVIQKIGQAISATALLLDPEPPIIL
jgi:hypothetical protein